MIVFVLLTAAAVIVPTVAVFLRSRRPSIPTGSAGPK